MKRKLYYPKNQIRTGLNTSGKEWRTKTGKEYIGMYHVTVDGLTRSGPFPETDSIDLFQFTFGNKSKDIYSNINTESPYIQPTSYFPGNNITKKDRKKEYFTRYILYKRNDKSYIVEVNKKQYDLWKQEKSGIDNKLYNVLSIRWKIEGPEFDYTTPDGIIKGVVDTNRRTIKNNSDKLPDIVRFLSDPREFSPYESLYNQPTFDKLEEEINKDLREGDPAPVGGGSDKTETPVFNLPPFPEPPTAKVNFTRENEDYIDFGTGKAWIDSNDFEIEVKVSGLETPTVGTIQGIIGQSKSGSGSGRWSLFLNNVSSKNEFFFHIGEAADGATLTSTIVTNCTIKITGKLNIFNLYIDDVLVDSNSGNISVVIPNYRMLIAAYNDATGVIPFNFLNGTVHWAKITSFGYTNTIGLNEGSGRYTTTTQGDIGELKTSNLGDLDYIDNNMWKDAVPFELVIETTLVDEIVTLPFSVGYVVDATVDWGDTNSSHPTFYNDPNATHTYSSPGQYTISINGTMESFYELQLGTFKLYPIEVLEWGTTGLKKIEFNRCSKLISIPTDKEGSFINLEAVSFVLCTALTVLPPGLFDHTTKIITFNGCFWGCKFTSIPSGLFDTCTLVTSFASTFSDCINITDHIPTGLFDNCPLVTSFARTFYNCNQLTDSIPVGLFDNNPLVIDFSYTFYICAQITGSIPDYLFKFNTEVITFNNTFRGAIGLTGIIPSTLFSTNTKAEDFSTTFLQYQGDISPGLFDNCIAATSFKAIFWASKITYIPDGLFDNCPLVTNFSNTFRNCILILGSIPTGLFDNNTLVTDFFNTFYGCTGLTGFIPLGLFDNCPNITSLAGTFYNCNQLTGSAPDLWNNYAPDTVGADCFKLDDFYNQYYIPEYWGGLPPVAFELVIETTQVDEIVTLPFSAGYNVDAIVDWGDSSATTNPTYYNDPLAVHTYSTPGQYAISIDGLMESFYVNNGAFNLLPIQVNEWGTTGLKQLSFHGCTNLISIPADTKGSFLYIEIFSNTFRSTSITSIPTDLLAFAVTQPYFGYMFYDCYGLTSIPDNIFDNCISATNFTAVFRGCNNITNALPSNLFRYNTEITNVSTAFQYCDSITGTFPVNFFKYNTKLTDLSYTFQRCRSITGDLPLEFFKHNPDLTTLRSSFFECNGITGIPEGLFDYNPLITNFEGTFYQTNSVTHSIPEKLFRNNPLATNFYRTFQNSTVTGPIPVDLFRYNPLVTSFTNTFSGCLGITSIPADLFKNNQKVTSFSGAFNTCIAITIIPPGLFDWNPVVTNMQSIFQNCSGIIGSIPEDLFQYNIIATNFNRVFMDCRAMTGTIPPDIFKFNTKVISFGGDWFYSGAFKGCRSLTGSIPEGLFANCPLVTNFGSTFNDCGKLTGVLPPDLFKYNVLASFFEGTFSLCSGLTGPIPPDFFRYCPDIYAIGGVFNGCSGLTGSIPVDLFRYNTNITSFSFYYYKIGVFQGCSGLTGSIPEDLFQYNTLATRFGGVFHGCSGLTGSIPEGLLRNNIAAYDFGGANGANSYGFMEGCTGLTGTIPLDLFRYCVDAIIFDGAFRNTGLSGAIGDIFQYNIKAETFYKTFAYSDGFTSISPSLFNTCTLAISFAHTFLNCEGITAIPSGLFDFNTQVTSFYGTFQQCNGLVSAIPSGLFDFNTQVTVFSATFYGCTGITGSIPPGLFDFNTQVTSMLLSFYNCYNITGSIPTGLFDACELVTDINSVFRQCNGLTGAIPVDLFRYNILLTSFYRVFYACSGLTSIPVDLAKYNVSLDRVDQMFVNCTGLTGPIPATIFANNPLITTFYATFQNCTSLTGDAPDLWNDFPTANGDNCYLYDNFDNQASIPVGWK